MPTHRARPSRWPRLRTAAIALSVGAAALTIPTVAASAGERSASVTAEPADDAGAPIEPAVSGATASAEPTAKEAASKSPEPDADGGDRADDADDAEDAGERDEGERDEGERDESGPDEADAARNATTSASSSTGAADADADAEVEPAEPGGPVADEASEATTGVEEPERIEGGDRVETSVAVARDRFPDGERAVVLASAEDFADALAGSALADHVDGPLLLTGQHELDQRVAAELTDQLAPGSTVWLLGGTEALGDDVENAVADLGFRTERLAGGDRYGTAAAIVREVVGEGAGCELVVATGTDFADGASASGFATATRPLLFTRDEKVPGPTADELARCAEDDGDVTVTAVGGSAARALAREGSGLPGDLEVTEVVGEDRYATSAGLLTLVRGTRDDQAKVPDAGGPVTLTSGLDFPDALIGGTYGHPVVLTEAEGLPASVAEALEGAQDNVDGVLVVGGTESVPEDVARDAASLAADGTAPAVSDEVAVEGPPVNEGDAPGTSTGTPTAVSSAAAGSSPKGSTSSPTTTTGPTAPAPAAPGVGAAPRSWSQAWGAKDVEVMRAWFETNVPGPRVPVRGTVEGGKIQDQGDADRLVGKKVTSSLSVSCTCTLHDFVLENAGLTINGGQVAVEDVLVDGKGNTKLTGLVTVRGSAKVDLRRVQIKGHQDGIRTYTSGYTHGENVYIHSHAKDNPQKHHQDGIQTIGGASALSRSFVDMTGAMVSATLIKPDASPIPYAKINSSVMLGGGYTFSIHDGPKGTPKNVDLSGNLVGPGYKKGLMSTWQLSNPGAVSTSATVSGTGRTVTLKDAAKL